ncbi:p100K [Mastadenovirus porcusquartum]|uniref:Shutoff protein n=1 Tax=Mastadenovirus porcusquartum TaxID=3241439 RepID=A0A5P9VI61_9ADEN|nr:p100K [Porcine mastadenovirus B]QFX65728.1 p100K [Porcine mastadenovirus B]
MAEEGSQSLSPQEPQELEDYVCGNDVLLKHLQRQSLIIKECLRDGGGDSLLDITSLSHAYESLLFNPATPPRRESNGVCEKDPRLNFFPPFMLPELLATYHIFFHNQKIPLSCRANRTRANEKLQLKWGARLPVPPTVEDVPKIFEGLGDGEELAENALQESQGESALLELRGDNPRLAVLKRSIRVTHFAYPAVNLPPKVMNAMMDTLLTRRKTPVQDSTEAQDEEVEHVVSDEELAAWLKVPIDSNQLQERRKTMMAAILISVQLECMRRFFSRKEVMRKLGENLHYMFRHGYVKQACVISNVELCQLISYMGVLHENRLGQSILHHSLQGEAREDYTRDTVYLYLIYTWQTAMGAWQQCLEEANVKELEKILARARRSLWTGFDETTITQELASLIFPTALMQALQDGLPDLTSQSMMQNFRSFILERSGILPAMCNALPSDFVPLTFKECPPPLWCYTYALQLANFIMYHNDIAYDVSGEGLMSCYCRCNLCSPHRCLVTNSALLAETQLINTFEIQGPPGDDGQPSSSLKLTPAAWTSAYLRKFIPEDYHPHEIRFYEDQSNKPKVDPSACVITQQAVLSQLHEIKKARENHLLQKGRGVYLDPQTGEVLSGQHGPPQTDEQPGQRPRGQRVRDRAQPGRRRAPDSRADAKGKTCQKKEMGPHA